MKLSLLLLYTLLSFAVHAQKEINLDDAIRHVNKQVTVTGRVLDARVLATEATPVFLKLGNVDTDAYLMVMILGDYSLSFAAAPKDALQKRVRVSGKVQLYNGRPMIVAKQPNQLVMLPEKRDRLGMFKN